jgi:DNA-binding MarR family transcriptional regulator
MMDSPSDYYYGVLWNKLYRNSILQEYGVIMDEDVSFAEDFIFNLEYLLHVHKVVALQTPVYLYYKTEGSLVSSVSLSKVVAMKTNVFTYYNDFYRNILDEKQYRHDRLAIAGFLFDSAQDEFTLPFLPGTSKVGKENAVPFVASHANAATFAYYSNELMERYLREAARKYDLKTDDVKVLAAIHYGSSFTMSGITDFTGLSSMNVAASVSRLIMRKYLKPVVSLKEKDAAVEAGKEAQPLLAAIDQAIKDYEDCLMEGFSEAERKQFSSFETRMNANISRRLKNARS